MSNELVAVQEVTTVAPKAIVKCTKCGKVAIKADQVRDEEGILLAVKYVHEMIPASGYVLTCTQVMEHQPIFNTNGSMKKEMEKRPYAFKQKGSFSELDKLTPEHYIRNRDVKHHSGLAGGKVGNR